MADGTPARDGAGSLRAAYLPMTGERAGTVVLVGLGEVGGVMARELSDLGVRVRAVDGRLQHPATSASAGELGIDVEPSLSLSPDEAGVVLSCVPGRAALGVAEYILPSIEGRSFAYADLTAKPVAVRDDIARLCAESRVLFADIALCDPITWPGDVELITSGPGTPALERLFAGTRFKVTAVSTSRCLSSEIKLCRSTFTKGLSALLIETLAAASALGTVEVVFAGISRLLDAGGERVTELLVGTALQHAGRRAEEARAAEHLMLSLLGSAPMAGASAVAWQDIARAAAGSSAGPARPWRDALQMLAHEPSEPAPSETGPARYRPVQTTIRGAAS